MPFAKRDPDVLLPVSIAENGEDDYSTRVLCGRQRPPASDGVVTPSAALLGVAGSILALTWRRGYRCSSGVGMAGA